MHWGKLQRECHRLLDEVFDTRKDGYKWLRDNFGVQHFSQLKHGDDMQKLESIYQKLYIKSITNETL